MGAFMLSVTFFALYYIIASAEAAGNCPLPSKVYSCSPKCVQNYDCSHGKVCCSNNCNSKSCTEPAANGVGGAGDKYSQSGGSGIYCGNVKCSPHEKCITDPSTKRQKCGRA